MEAQKAIFVLVNTKIDLTFLTKEVRAAFTPRQLTGWGNVPGIVFTIYIFVFYLRLMSQN